MKSMMTAEYKDHPVDLQARANKFFNEAMGMWSGLVSTALLTFMLFSSFDFSFLLTLSSLVSTASFVMVIISIVRRQSVAGVSRKMMECYMVVFLSRLVAIVPYEGYLPFDKSGDWLYQSCEGFGFLGAAVICYCCRRSYASTYNADVDGINHLWLMAPTLGVACVLHTNLDGYLPCDIAWAFALYLEAVTVLPQLFMFMEEKSTQPHTSHFLAAQALAKLMSFAFWASSFSELAHEDHPINQYAGHWVVVVQLIQLVIMGDFIYHYVRCVRKGIPVSEMMHFVDAV
mmetsp:Transcript_60759/g.157621  ORF Transcript_60759/g.157621 Transcript_60759/m.157621 type:complete len:287 (-) Transcript_60759:255-1115(-)